MTSWKIWRPEESGKAGTRKYGDKMNLEKITLENNSCNTVKLKDLYVKRPYCNIRYYQFLDRTS